MRKITALFLLVVLWPSIIFAGVVGGSIKKDGRPLGEGVEIRIIPEGSNSNKPYSTQTDKFGSYRCNLKEIGKCKFILVNYENQSPAIEIYSYEGPIEYNLILEKNEEENYYLVRE
ncbi:MAG: hypothetical protein ACMUJM_15010 [bacterium]